MAPHETDDNTIGTRQEWLATREQLLVREKEHTRHGDDLARTPLALPRFESARGPRFELPAVPSP